MNILHKFTSINCFWFRGELPRSPAFTRIVYVVFVIRLLERASTVNAGYLHQAQEPIRKDLLAMQALYDTKEFLQHLLPLPPNSEERLSSLLDALLRDGLYQDSK